VAEATAVARTVGHGAVDVLIDYMAPLAGAVAGLLYNVGGVNGLTNAINTGPQGMGDVIPPASVNRIAGGIFATIWFGVGYLFWRIGKRDGWIEHLIGRTVGAFFFAQSLRCLVMYTIANQSPQPGPIDNLFTWTNKVASGG